MTFFEDEDFVSVVSSSNSRKVEVVEMKNADVLNWKDGHSSVKTKKAPNLSKISVIPFNKRAPPLWSP